MKRFLYALLSFALVGAVVGCSDDDTITPESEDSIENPLVYEADQVVFGSQKSEKIITLTNIESDNFLITRPAADKWYSFAKGEGNTIVVSVKANASDIRESKITAQSGRIVEEIPIWQDAPRSIKFPQIPDLRGTGGSTTFDFTANIAAPFEVKVADADQSWLNVTVDGEAKTVTATVGQNIPKAGDRTGSFTISGYSEFGDFVETEVSVTQVGIDRPNYKFSLPDFSASKVYKVMNNGEQIAEVCLEFLGSENAAAGVTVDAQAVVVYPMASNGKADLSNGYVAKIIKANTGDNKYTYAAPTAAVHGGSVVWDTANNCISAYTSGTEAAPVETVVIPADNFVFTAETFAEMTELSTEPYLVVDNRPNDFPWTYSVVKVGTQYWLREVLRARCFVDGTKIPNLTTAEGAVRPELTTAKQPYCLLRAINDEGTTHNYQDLWDEDRQNEIQKRLVDGFMLYNLLCINNITIPDSYDSALAYFTANYSGSYADLPAEGNVLAPDGWMLPTRTQQLAMRSYVLENTNYNSAMGLGFSKDNYTYLRRMQHVSCFEHTNIAPKMTWATDIDITGFGMVLAPMVNATNSYWPSGTNPMYGYYLSSSIMPGMISDGNSNSKLNLEGVGSCLFGLQNASLDLHFYNMAYCNAVRCIRK